MASLTKSHVRIPKILSFNNKPAIVVGNENIQIVILTGGGHIAAVYNSDLPDINPLWEPEWETTTPAMRRIVARDFSQSEEDRLESELLACIGGHNLCCDVFGAHSTGEVSSGASFHGEAGLTTWEVTDINEKIGSITMKAYLPRTQMTVERSYFPNLANLPRIDVVERITNLLSIERAFGRSQHVTLGKKMLEQRSGQCRFDCNGDNGLTWPEVADKSSTFKCNEPFEYPNIPSNVNDFCDWRMYPRTDVNSDLCTLRVNPKDEHGWFTCAKDIATPAGSGNDSSCQNKSLLLVYKWERKVFPWLMSWEENFARQVKPWSGRTLTRGLEFGSYAMALGRRWNVQQNKLFDTLCYEWIDANEMKETTFTIGMKVCHDVNEEKIFKDTILAHGVRSGQ